MATLLGLAKRLEAKANKLEKGASEINKQVALFLEGALLWDTPVDTSQALSNWTLTLGAPDYEFIGPHVPGEHGSTQTASIAEAYSLAKAAAAKKKPGQEIWLSNNAPYIVDLNAGSSLQAPAGYVQSCVFRARSQIPAIAKKVL